MMISVQEKSSDEFFLQRLFMFHNEEEKCWALDVIWLWPQSCQNISKVDKSSVARQVHFGTVLTKTQIKVDFF